MMRMILEALRILLEEDMEIPRKRLRRKMPLAVVDRPP